MSIRVSSILVATATATAAAVSVATLGYKEREVLAKTISTVADALVVPHIYECATAYGTARVDNYTQAVFKDAAGKVIFKTSGVLVSDEMADAFCKNGQHPPFHSIQADEGWINQSFSCEGERGQTARVDTYFSGVSYREGNGFHIQGGYSYVEARSYAFNYCATALSARDQVPPRGKAPRTQSGEQPSPRS